MWSATQTVCRRAATTNPRRGNPSVQSTAEMDTALQRCDDSLEFFVSFYIRINMNINNRFVFCVFCGKIVGK